MELASVLLILYFGGAYFIFEVAELAFIEFDLRCGLIFIVGWGHNAHWMFTVDGDASLSCERFAIKIL